MKNLCEIAKYVAICVKTDMPVIGKQQTAPLIIAETVNFHMKPTDN